MTGVRGALAVVLLLLLAACSVGDSAGDTVGDRPVPAEPEASAPDPTPASPARPREVRIDGVDPCALLTEEQRAELGLDGRPVFDLSPTSLYPGADVPACVISGFDPRAISVAVSLIASHGIEVYAAGELLVDTRPTEVQGFPALIAKPTRFTEWCSVIVDVAPGQLLDVQFADGGRLPPIPQSGLCEDAAAVADQAMLTLTAIR